MEYVIYLVIGGFLFYLILSHKKGDKNIVSHWYYHFEDLQTSSDELYKSIEQHLGYLAMPDIRITREWAFEAGIASSKRQYLRIYRGDNIFYVCAAPDGKCFFVSCWVKFAQPWADFLEYIPFVGASWARNARIRTMFQQDTQILFNETMKLAVGKAVDHLAETKGVRIFPIENRIYA